MTTSLRNTKKNQNRCSDTAKYQLDKIYGDHLPLIPRPRNNMSRPKTRLDKMYCWRYYLARILDPRTTGEVLSNLEQTPVFVADWGSRIERTKMQKKGNLVKKVLNRHKIVQKK